MTTPASPLSDRVPETVRKRLDELRASLEKILGDQLVSIVVHGSAVRGDYRTGDSDVDVVIVLREATHARLDAIANALQLARYSVRIEAMILEAGEIPRAADVYPLLYDDIQRSHVVLAGSDPFAGLAIADQHRRLRVEQELREAQIRLRRIAVDSVGAPALVAAAVVRKLRQVRSPLRALLGMRGENVGAELREVLNAAGKAYDVDVAALSNPHERPTEAYDTLARLLARAVDDVDRRGDEARA